MNVSDFYLRPILFATLFVLVLSKIISGNSTLKYFVKFTYVYLFYSALGILTLPFACLRPRDPRNLRLPSRISRICSPPLGLKWIVRNEEYLRRSGSFIIVCNHQSSLDFLGMLDFWHIMDKCTVVAKRGLLYAGPFGIAAWLCGLIFIPRVKGSSQNEARAIMNKAAEEIKAKKIKLWVFPEGTRRNDGQIHPFKKGAFHLAITAQLPILPVVFSQYYFLDKTNKRFDQGKVLVTALPPISTEGMTLDDLDKLMEQTREVMTTAFHKANKEVRESLRT